MHHHLTAHAYAGAWWFPFPVKVTYLWWYRVCIEKTYLGSHQTGLIIFDYNGARYFFMGPLVEILCYFEVYLKTDTCVTVIFKGIKIERKDCEDISRGIIFGPASNNQKENPPNHLQVVPQLGIRNDGVSYFAFIGTEWPL